MSIKSAIVPIITNYVWKNDSNYFTNYRLGIGLVASFA